MFILLTAPQCSHEAVLDVGSAPSDGEMELDASIEDFRPQKERHKIYEIEHTSLSQQEVEAVIKQDVTHITGIFGVDVSTFQVPYFWATAHIV